MLLKKQWSKIIDEQRYCQYCKRSTKGYHTPNWYWIINNDNNIGRACHVIGKTSDCNFITYLELWDSEKQRQDILEEVKNGNDEYQNITIQQLKTLVPKDSMS